MILLTGATGTIGKALLPRLLDAGHDVRALVREPRRLGRHRVDVRIVLGDLAEMRDPRIRRQALRGVESVIHLAAAIRDQPAARIEELNGLATVRLLRAAEQAGAGRFVFFSALNASDFQRTRFFRAKALAERAVAQSELSTTVFAPSIVYDRNDPWVRLTRRFSLLPLIPLAGRGEARFQPMWAADAAACVIADLARDGHASRRHELAGPEVLTYAKMTRLIARASGRERPLVRVPLNLVRLGLRGLRLVVGEPVFATWEEAELMEVAMVTPRGVADARTLGVEPRRMADVLGAGEMA